MLTVNLLLAALNGCTIYCRKRCVSDAHGIFSYSIDLRSTVKFMSYNISELMRNQQIFSLPMM